MTLPKSATPQETNVTRRKQQAALAARLIISDKQNTYSPCTGWAFMSRAQPYLTPAASILGQGVAGAGWGRRLTALQPCPRNRQHSSSGHKVDLAIHFSDCYVYTKTLMYIYIYIYIWRTLTGWCITFFEQVVRVLFH